jgi:hypothetical protein
MSALPGSLGVSFKTNTMLVSLIPLIVAVFLGVSPIHHDLCRLQNGKKPKAWNRIVFTLPAVYGGTTSNCVPLFIYRSPHIDSNNMLFTEIRRGFQ